MELPIINSIGNGNTRFREIERSIQGLTTRVLSLDLKEMEANQLIKRTVGATYDKTGQDSTYFSQFYLLVEMPAGRSAMGC
ncbi:MAG: HxlR family transcriptional regulator [Mucilaginibacter sp.]|nr:HxlR family transcriptional regulator [Mucilaginibacter sp.]